MMKTLSHFEATMFCKVCSSEKPTGAFYKGVESRCKDCHKAAMKLRRLKDPYVQEYERLRAKTPDRKKRARAVTKKWREDHPEANRAQRAVSYALSTGKLTRMPCELCGTEAHVHAHHSDYSKPLFVKWLCARCHHRLHAIFPQLRGHEVPA
jgi:hypothetical protein